MMTDEQHAALLEQVRDGFYGLQWDIQNAGREIAEAIRSLPVEPAALDRVISRLPPWPPARLKEALSAVSISSNSAVEQRRQDARDAERILGAIEKVGSISHRDLMRRLTVFKTGELSEITGALEREGSITVSRVSNPTNNKTTIMYTAASGVARKAAASRERVLQIISEGDGAVDRTNLSRRLNNSMNAFDLDEILTELMAEDIIRQVTAPGGKRGPRRKTYELTNPKKQNLPLTIVGHAGRKELDGRLFMGEAARPK